jgi:hypothetical protein
MSEEKHDYQLTGDDPMLEQIEAATATPEEGADRGAAPGSSREATAGEGRPPAVEPGEPESAQFEPDASQ